MRNVLIVAGAVAASAGAASATPVTIYQNPGQLGNSLTFDTSNVTNRAVASGLASFTNGSGMTDLHNQNLLPVVPPQHVRPSQITNTDTTYAPGTGFNRGTTSAGYYSFQGNQGIRGSLSIGWAAPDNSVLASANSAGFDLAIMEWSNNEGFLVRVQNAADGTWSGWRYTPASWSATDGAATPTHRTWITLLDYSNFGIASGGAVSRVEMMSIFAGDAGTGGAAGGLDPNGYWFDPSNASSGIVFHNPQHGGAFTMGPVAPYYSSSDLTADIWYAVSLSNLVPAPGAAGLFGIAGLAAMRRKRR